MKFLVTLILSCFTLGHFEIQWFGQRVLDPNYLFKWKTDSKNKSLIIRIECMTKGWVGFGFSRHGKTTEIDMAIGWVDDNGLSTFNDIWINKFGVRSLDSSQDWTLLSSEENATHTVFEFTRYYVTCDEFNDLEIYENDFEVSNIVFAYSFIDPNSIETIGEATVQGVIYLSLFESQDNIGSNYEIIDNWMNVTLLPKVANNFCQLSKINLTEKRYFIKFQGLVIPTDIELNHHFNWLKCPNIQDMYQLFGGFPHLCEDLMKKMLSIDKTRRCTSFKMRSNVLSNNVVVFPKGIGMSLDPTLDQYFLFNAHLINPTDLELKTKLSFRLWLTRNNFGNMLLAGSNLFSSNKNTIVPPMQPKFTIANFISSYCFESDNLNEIFIFQALIHTHHGQRAEIRHYRKNILNRVLYYNHYDNYEQIFRPITPSLIFKTGDKLALVCELNTINSTASSMTSEDHCGLVLLYYPEIPILNKYMVKYTSSYELILNITGLEAIQDFNIIKRPVQYKNTKLKNFIKEGNYKIKDPGQLEELQLKANRNVCCYLKNTINKSCKLLRAPSHFYESIFSGKSENSCARDKLSQKYNPDTINKIF